jgi:adenylate kinase family enzyme
MKKIVIIGSPGAGKTTLAQMLGDILSIRVIYLDRLFWKRDWQAVSGDERIDILQELVPDTRWPDGKWIMEGTYLQSSGPRLEAADTIIFLDLHPFLCIGRVIQRHYGNHGKFRRDLPKECTDKLTFSRLLYILMFAFEERQKLTETLYSYITPKEIIHLYSPGQVKDFVEGLKKKEEQFIDNKHIALAASQKEVGETRSPLHRVVSTIKAFGFFIRSCFAWLLYILAPKAFFSLRTRVHQTLRAEQQS